MDQIQDPMNDLLQRSRPALDDTEFANLSVAMATVIATQPRVRRTHRRLAIGLATAVALGVPTVAAATTHGFHTGIFGNPSKNTEDADRSEWLNTCSPSYSVAIQQDQPPASSPLPSGLTWSMATTYIRDMHAKGCANGQGGLMQEIGLKREYNFWAQCAWLRDASRTEDRTRLTTAASALRFYGGSVVNRATDGGGIVTMDLRVADQVAHGDVAAAREAATNCGSYGVKP